MKLSHWREVSRGVPPGSVLRPVLFNLFINYLELGMSILVAKFEDNIRLFLDLQEDWSKFGEWATLWQMMFTAGKSKVMPTGVLVDSSMKMLTCCVAVVKKVHLMLGIIRKRTENKTATCIKLLSRAMVWPHTKYCVQF